MVSDLTEQELKEWQDEVRSRKREEFGEIGEKPDCKNFGGNSCGILRELYCKSETCYFYENKHMNFHMNFEEDCEIP